jgi:hypothetical protein
MFRVVYLAPPLPFVRLPPPVRCCSFAAACSALFSWRPQFCLIDSIPLTSRRSSRRQFPLAIFVADFVPPMPGADFVASILLAKFMRLMLITELTPFHSIAFALHIVPGSLIALILLKISGQALRILLPLLVSSQASRSDKLLNGRISLNPNRREQTRQSGRQNHRHLI